MLKITADLKEEAQELKTLLDSLSEQEWKTKTTFKDWTPQEVVAHLYYFDLMAIYSFRDKDKFMSEAQFIGGTTELKTSYDRAVAVKERLDTKDYLDLKEKWFHSCNEMCELFSTADPKERMLWFGPDMGARMFITARFMETWSHGQEIYDLKKIKRSYTDNIKHVATIGVRTFGWTYVNRGLEIPQNVPYIKIHSPSGETWEWNEPNQNNYVEGEAVDFCHVVTQGRNVKETNLRVVGDTASHWMSIAQCFAGGAEEPPLSGTRSS